ncbi:MAG: molybdopterin-dependent oxidoreductase [Hyphomicrobiaceae bacterium]|nr:molybdopterin-dependent oxidoreductase [Hyphomicrobiaceae bacterium]
MQQPDRKPASNTVRTTCPYCGVGCGVLATPIGAEAARIEGDTEHPANFGRLCSKGSALGETLSLDDRLLEPRIGENPANWESALDLVAKKFSEAIAEHGPDSVALYVSGQLLTEDYYVANKLMKGFVGSANIDTNSRLCMSSSVAGHKRAFGSDTVPGTYEDLEQADLVVLVGSNLAWCHPVLFQRLMAAKTKRGTRIVAIDPRATVTTESADMHLAIAPGADVMLFNGLLRELVECQALDRRYIDDHTAGFDAAVAVAQDAEMAEVARVTEIDADDIQAFYDLFIRHERVVTIYSQGVNQSTSGTDKVNAIINCHLASGRIGRPGMGPFSVTGQPNAMGGREVGGLANMLACHMDIERSDHREIVGTFWNTSRLSSKPGLKALDLIRATAEGRIKVLWVLATSPVDSLPEADAVRDALQKCPFLVVSEVARKTDTSELAHVLLPSLGWGEKDGTVTNSERRISRQRAFLPAPGQARADWWQLAEVAKRLGYAAAFDYACSADIFAEYAALSAFRNEGSRDFDIGAYAEITKDGYDALEPFQWPQPPSASSAQTRFFADGNFYTADRRARFVETRFRDVSEPTSSAYPFVLNTGRIRDQWHTMTRTAKTPRLLSHIAEPFVEVNPADAEAVGLADASLALLSSPHGEAVLRVIKTSRQRRGALFAPMHWTDQLAATGRINKLVASRSDPVSGQPELKAAPVSIRPFDARWHAFAIVANKPEKIACAYYSIARAKAGWRIELAGRDEPSDMEKFARALIAPKPDADVISYSDMKSGQFRFAAFSNDRLVGAIFIDRQPVAVSRNFAAEALGADWPSQNRLCLLAGRPGADQRDRGAIVCSCFEVGLNDIIDAVINGHHVTVEAIGAALQAGTNCGSCRPEIGRIIRAHTLAKAG